MGPKSRRIPNGFFVKPNRRLDSHHVALDLKCPGLLSQRDLRMVAKQLVVPRMDLAP